MITETLGDVLRRVVDGAAALLTLGALTSVLPHLTALIGLIWYAIPVYETKTVQRLRRRRRAVRRIRASEDGR